MVDTKNHAACQEQNGKIFAAAVIFRKLLPRNKLRKNHWLNRRFAAWPGEKIPASSAAVHLRRDCDVAARSPGHAHPSKRGRINPRRGGKKNQFEIEV
jgi:hypothetical protein